MTGLMPILSGTVSANVNVVTAAAPQPPSRQLGCVVCMMKHYTMIATALLELRCTALAGTMPALNATAL